MSYEDLMKELQSSYLLQLPDRIEEIKIFIKNENKQALLEEFHKLKGTGATYGFPEITQVAKEAEAYLNQEKNFEADKIHKFLKDIEEIF